MLRIMMENNIPEKDYDLQQDQQSTTDSFICQACNNNLPIEFNVRTKGFCYLCDPNLTLEECLSDLTLESVPKDII